MEREGLGTGNHLQPIMDPSIWNELPHDLLIRVLASLPLFSLIRFRCIGKYWNSLIHSSYFRKISAEIEASSSIGPYPAVCFMPSRKGKGLQWLVYDLGVNNWQRMPPLPLHLLTSVYERNHISAGAGGLFCMRKWEESHFTKYLSVWNPLTETGMDMPPLINRWSNSAVRQMFIDEKTNAYKIILAGNEGYAIDDERYQTTDIYDAESGSWKEGGQFLPCKSVSHQQGALCKGVLYFLATREKTEENVLLICYNVQVDVWSEVPHILPENFNGFPQLFECKGRLFMMLNTHVGGDGLESCCFFELVFLTNEWAHFLQMPAEMYSRFSCVRGCMASDSRLFVTGDSDDAKVLVAVYEMDRGTWVWLPPCPVTASSDETCVSFSFQPSLRPIN